MGELDTAGVLLVSKTKGGIDRTKAKIYRNKARDLPNTDRKKTRILPPGPNAKCLDTGREESVADR